MAKSDLKLTGDSSQLQAELKKVQRELEKVKQKTRDVGTQSKKTSAVQSQAFGSQATSKLASYAAGFVGIGAAISVAARAFSKWNEEQDKAAGKMKTAEMPLGQLSELSGGDPKRLRKLIDAAKLMYRAGGAESLGSAADTVYALESAGKLQQAPLFAQLYGTLKDPAAMARAVTALQTSMGEKETGGLKQMLTKGIAVNPFAPATAPELLEAASISGGAAKALGWTDEGLLAAVALTSKATGKATTGGTQIRAFASQLMKKPEFEGLGIVEAVEKIKAKRLDMTGLKKVLGETRAIAAYQTLAEQLPQLKEIREHLGKVQDTDLLARTIAARKGAPEIAVPMEARMQAAEEELALERFGARRIATDMMIKDRRAYMISRGEPGMFVGLEELRVKMWRGILGDDYAMWEWGTPSQQARMAEVDAALAGGGDLDQPSSAGSAAIDRLTEAVNRNTDAQGGGSQRALPNEDYPGGP